ncbi:MAG TPA: hypothetical protein VJV23_03860 [Candidatus Polarisedimenticolia bacterium]|nr:hypothetical protein [Candidatus Polarisedimenticolia bacterium]
MGCLLAAALLGGALAPSAGSGAPAATRVEIVLGLRERGEPTALWVEMARRHARPEAADLGAELPARPFDEDELRWVERIVPRAARWESLAGEVAAPFHPIPPPPHVLVVLGNQGADDAFTHDASTIGFDLSKLSALYGPAADEGNAARVDRFFRHEMTHLMQKAWLARHPFETGSPWREALLDLWLEGLGHWHSLSDPWRATAAGPGPKAAAALAALEPRFVSRMAALACAPPAEARRLMADLSRGAFEAKWGALPTALWVEAEASRDQAALRAFVQAGPEGVLDLAGRNLSPAPRAVLDEARRAAAICRGR